MAHAIIHEVTINIKQVSGSYPHFTDDADSPYDDTDGLICDVILEIRVITKMRQHQCRGMVQGPCVVSRSVRSIPSGRSIRSGQGTR